MNKFLFSFLYLFTVFSLYGLQEYVEPQDVATTEGIPSSLINQSVCAISGEYIDSIVDVVLPGPEPLVISRVYNSFCRTKPWAFNHYDKLILGNVIYDEAPSYMVAFRQPSNAQLDYVFEKKEGYEKLKKIPFKLVVPKGLTNGASILSGKTNIKNQTLHYYPHEEMIVAKTGAGNRKIFKKIKANAEGWPMCGQVAEEKVNGSRLRYQGKGQGLSVEEIICENQANHKRYSSVKFSIKPLAEGMLLQTLTTSDGRKLHYSFKPHQYRVKEKLKNAENSYYVDRLYLSKVEHPYAPHEKYRYEEKALGGDMQLTAKLRDEGRRFVNIDYYHRGVNHVGGEVGFVDLKEKDDFRLDRVKRLEAPVGTDQTPITTHRFDYHAQIKTHKKDGHKKVAQGYTDVYDAENHKIRYAYDEDHRLTSLTRYSGTDASSYVPYTKECFVWNEEGWLMAKIFKDGEGNIHHARAFTYDSHGNVLTSTLCGKLTGRSSPPILLDSKGKIIENGYERETKSYTYSHDGLNLLLTETDSAGKTIHYKYQKKTDRLKAKYLSYEGSIRLREFYFYDPNHALEQKILDDGCHEPDQDLLFVNERHYTLITPRTEFPVGFPQVSEERVHDFQTQDKILLKRSIFAYSPQGQLLEQQVFDAQNAPAYTLQWTYDLHGNLTSETNALGVTIQKTYDLATDNLIKQHTLDVTISNTYDFANRLIEQKERHPDCDFVTSYRYDYLGHCKATFNPYGHKTRQFYDDFGRVIEIHYPELPKDGILTTPIVKTAYDIAGFPISITDATGRTTSIEVNIRGQPTKICYPDGSQEEMLYSLEGWLMQKTAKNGTRTEYVRDPLGRITQETIVGADGVKQTLNRYNAFHLMESVDPEGHLTTYSYDPAGRLREVVKHDSKTEYLYDSLGRLSEIREYDGHGSHEYRATIKTYDNLDRVKEERMQTAEGHVLHFSCYEYDLYGNRTLVQTGDQKTITEYNTWKQPIRITDGLGHQTHFEYNTHFINAYGQRVLQKTTTDPLGYRTIETYDVANRLNESLQLNPLGVKIARQAFSYDLLGNQTKVEEDVIEDGNVVRTIATLLVYHTAGQLMQITEAAGTPEQKITRFRYNAFGQKEALMKPNGNEIHYTYDAFERLKTQTSIDQSIAYLYEYNLLDQVIRVTDQHSGRATTRDYVQEKLRKETLANGLSVEYTYDRTGRARTLLFPDQTGVEYVYNAVDLKEIYRLKQGQRTYVHRDLEHSLAGQITKAEPPGNHGTIAYHFDPLGRCLLIDSPAFRQHVPPDGFDAAGHLVKFERQNVAYEFAYDDHYQVKSETGHCCHTYSFDSLANRTAKDGERHYYNALNQLVKKGEQELAYDLNGNLIRQGPNEYVYDALDRLIKVTCQGNEVTYSYDAFDRRIARNRQGEEELFLYQGQDEIGRWKNGICQEIRLLGKNRQSQTVALEIQGTPYVPLHDIQGNIISLLNLQGQIVEQYLYTAYGEREILSPSGEKRLQSELANPWQYAGKRIDEESGLIAFGMRYYDPRLGRWITPDPIGFTDGSNLYAYVHNDPLQYFDEFGLFTEAIFGIGGSLYHSAESNYQKYCIPLGVGQFCGEEEFKIWHVNIEDKLEAEHNFRKKSDDTLFHRTQVYYANDFIDPKTGKNYNFKPLPKGKDITYMNGIGNTLDDFQKSLIQIAERTGYNIRGVFCPTFGFTMDAMCYKHALLDGAAYEGVRVLQKIIQEFHANSSPGATMLIIPHSRGAVYVRNALIDCPQELRDRVELRAFAPGGYTDPYLCKAVGHYESEKDIVPKFDRNGRRRCKDTLTTLEPHSGASFLDHEFTSHTYADTLEIEIEKYIQR